LNSSFINDILLRKRKSNYILENIETATNLLERNYLHVLLPGLKLYRPT